MHAHAAGPAYESADQHQDQHQAQEHPASPSRKGMGGPKTEEGKARSRRNALKHGLRARAVLPDDLAELVHGRTERFAQEFQPETDYQYWLVGQIATASVQLERIAELRRADETRRLERAELCWSCDRRKHIETVAARLASDPSRIYWIVRQTRQGVFWMIERWEGLRAALRADGPWNAERRSLAMDLLGIPHALRSGRVELPENATVAQLDQLVAQQLAALQEEGTLACISELDETERQMVWLGLPIAEDTTTRTLRRQEADCRRMVRWAVKEFRQLKGGGPAFMPFAAEPADDAPYTARTASGLPALDPASLPDLPARKTPEPPRPSPPPPPPPASASASASAPSAPSPPPLPPQNWLDEASGEPGTVPVPPVPDLETLLRERAWSIEAARRFREDPEAVIPDISEFDHLGRHELLTLSDTRPSRRARERRRRQALMTDARSRS